MCPLNYSGGIKNFTKGYIKKSKKNMTDQKIHEECTKKRGKYVTGEIRTHEYLGPALSKHLKLLGYNILFY